MENIEQEIVKMEQEIRDKKSALLVCDDNIERSELEEKLQHSIKG